MSCQSSSVLHLLTFFLYNLLSLPHLFFTPILNLHIFMFCCFFYILFAVFFHLISLQFLFSLSFDMLCVCQRGLSACFSHHHRLSLVRVTVSSFVHCCVFPAPPLCLCLHQNLSVCLRTVHVFTGLVMHLSVHSSPCFCICMYVCQYLRLCVCVRARVSVHVRVVLSVPADGSSLSSIVPVK